MTSEDIVAAYKAQNPRASTNKAVVADLAQRSGKTIAQVRGILIFNHVYMSVPDNERFAPDGTELKTIFTDDEVQALWADYQCANPKDAETERVVDELAAKYVATRYLVTSTLSRPDRRLTYNEDVRAAAQEAALDRRQAQREAQKREASRGMWKFAALLLLAVVGIGYVLSRTGSSGNGSPASADTSSERYDALSPEGKRYVREQMRKYDEVCAKSADC